MTTPSHRFVRKRLRAPEYDYSLPGMYWITICTHHMECRFGEVRDGLMLVNEAGLIVDRHWKALSERYPGVLLDAYIVMPNHLHGIVFLEGEGPPPPSLSAMIGAFKSMTTVEYTRGVHDGRFPQYDRTLWQRSFQDRIVQTDRRYVEGNPGRWQEKQEARIP